MSVIVVLCECIAPFLVTVAAPYPQKIRLLFSTPTSGAEGTLRTPLPTILGTSISQLQPLRWICPLRGSRSFQQ